MKVFSRQKPLPIRIRFQAPLFSKGRTFIAAAFRQSSSDSGIQERMQRSVETTNRLFDVLIESAAKSPPKEGPWNVFSAIHSRNLSLRTDYRQISRLENRIYGELLESASANNPNVRAQARKIRGWIRRMINLACLNSWNPSGGDIPYACPSAFGIQELETILQRTITPYCHLLNREGERRIKVFSVTDPTINLHVITEEMRTNDFSQIVIQTSTQFAVITINDLSRCRRAFRVTDQNTLSRIPLSETLNYIVPGNCRFMGPRASLDAIRVALKEMLEVQTESAPVAVVITKTGNNPLEGNEVLDIITADDVLHSRSRLKNDLTATADGLSINPIVGKFLKHFAPLEDRIRKLAEMSDSEDGIHGVIGIAHKKGRVRTEVFQELLYWVIFRNQWAHDRYIFSDRLWFEITSLGFARFKTLSEEVFQPKPVFPEFRKENLKLFPLDTPLEEVDRYMEDHNFSQVVVRKDNGEYDLLTEEGIYYLISQEGLDLQGKTVRDALAFEPPGRRLGILATSATVDDARNMLLDLSQGEYSSRWVAILIMEQDKPAGLITINDSARLNNPWKRI